MNDCTPRLTRLTPQRNSAFEHLRSQRSRGTLDGDFGIRRHVRTAANRIENSLQLSGVEDRGRAAAEIDGVHFALDPPAHLAWRSVGSSRDVGAHAIDVALEHRAREHVGGEVAVAALGAAERHRNVDSQGHCLRLSHSQTFSILLGRLGHLFEVPCWKAPPAPSARF